MTLRELEPAAEWRASDVADPEAWTLRLTEADQAELDAALRTAKATSTDPLHWVHFQHTPRFVDAVLRHQPP